MRKITYLEAVREALQLAMERDERVFLLGEDIGVYGGAFGVTFGMMDAFGPERVRDTPISELTIAGTAVGAALTGMRPVMEYMFMDFSSLGMEQLANQAAKIHFMLGDQASVPMVVRAPAGCGTGAAAQHSQSLEAWFVHVPGIKVVMPSTPYDAKGLLLASIEDPNPVFFVEHKLLYRTTGDVPEDYYTVPLGKAEVKREGQDVTVIATSIMVPRALKAAAKLAEEGIDLEVVDPRCLKPLDEETLFNSVIKTGKVVIVHEACKTGGIGGEIAARLAESEAFDYLDAPIVRLAGEDAPIPYNRTLEYHTVPQEETIINAVRKVMQRRV